MALPFHFFSIALVLSWLSFLKAVFTTPGLAPITPGLTLTTPGLAPTTPGLAPFTLAEWDNDDDDDDDYDDDDLC